MVLLWIINFVISCFNAWGCGKSWTESKADGGFPHLLNWCGAIMSAVGFTWCYLLILGQLGANIPFEHEVNGHTVNAPYLSADTLKVFYQLGYLAIVVPLLGSGLVITVNSWSYFWRRRTFGSAAETAWNSYAMFENIYSASYEIAESSHGVAGFFGGDSDEDGIWTLLLVLAIIAILAGCFTTYKILTVTQKGTAFDRRFRYERIT